MMTTIPLLFLFCSLIPTISAANSSCNSHCRPATEFLHTLPDLAQRNVRHCTSLPTAHERLLCELTGAIDAQGRRPTSNPPNAATFKQSTPPAAMNRSRKSCKFREDDVYSLYPYAAPSSRELDAVMEKYKAMHERCVNAVDSSLFLHNISSIMNGTSLPPVCRYLLWKTNDAGLGNRLTSLITAFVYAIVSARVLLIDYPEYDGLFCDPFHRSSIHIPPQFRFDPHAIGPTYLQFRDACRYGGTARSNVDATNATACNSSVVNLILHYKGRVQNHEAFLCPTGYARLRNVPIVTWSDSHIYLVPEFYVNPVLSPLLDALFPQRNPFQLLSRTIFVPNDAMWARIRSNLDPFAGIRIGVQIREFEYWKNKYTDSADVNVLKCIRTMGGLVPHSVRESRRLSHVTVYMATFVKRHIEAMSSNLGVLTDLTGREFRLRFPKIDEWQENDLKHQQEAMIDMWTLSFSHVLFTTKASSCFGYVATALSGMTRAHLGGGIRWWVLPWVGPEPCNFHFPASHSCVQDEGVAFNVGDVARNDSKVHECANRWGWMLLPENVMIH